MPKLFRRLALASLFFAMHAAMPAQQPSRATAAVATQASAAAPSAEDMGQLQAKLMDLLRVSPTLANVVASDPSLLANQEYVGRNNPQLAQLLQENPEITRNPSFYLFSDLRTPNQKPYRVLEPKRGFEEHEYVDRRGAGERMLNDIVPIIAMVIIVSAVLWLVRLLVDNRRWKRVFTLQNDVHTKLIDKFAANQELIGYMETDAGRRFLEAAPIATDADQQRLPNVVARVLSTLQIGTVLTLLGVGVLALRHSVGEAETAMLVLGTLALMPGLGLILSAGITWLMGKRLGLIGSAGTTGAAHAYETRER